MNQNQVGSVGSVGSGPIRRGDAFVSVDKQISEIDFQNNGLTDAITRMDQSMKVLEERLQVVLGKGEAPQAELNVKEEEPRTALGTTLQIHKNHVNRMHCDLRRIIEQLAL